MWKNSHKYQLFLADKTDKFLGIAFNRLYGNEETK
jgi:hypothetical protein